jgi:RNA polymerase sigma-70 factor (ECF subfamily)
MDVTQRLNQSDPISDNNIETIDACPPGAPDSDLISSVAGGDEQAFADLYRLYSTSLYNYLRNLVIDEAAAEDLLQDVFIAVWNGARRFRGESQVKTWIYHIAHNQAVSWFRSNHRIVRAHDHDQPSGEPDLETRAINHWRNDQIREALNQLSPSHREVVELAFFHDLSYLEIAAVVGCPVGTVKSRMSYARRSLNIVFQQLGLGVRQT